LDLHHHPRNRSQQLRYHPSGYDLQDAGEDLKKFNVPTLILHGEDDQIVPIGTSALLSSKIVKGSTLKVYPGLPHGMCTTHKNVINEDLLTFIKA
ncbi:alpha/beta hydrolase, partial [bacterium]|nr:alpha/beta hydrolase [bacterium]